MAPVKAQTFGKRGAPAAARAPGAPVSRTPAPAQKIEAALAATESGVPLDVLAKQLMSGAFEDALAASKPPAPAGVVPWSWRAAFLAGFAASCLQAGLVVLQAQHATPILPGVPFEVGGEGAVTTPALIAAALWTSAQDAATALLLSHFGLRALNISSPLAYAVGGAAGGALSAYATRLLLGGEDAMLTDAITGLISGFLFRMFAGLKAA